MKTPPLLLLAALTFWGWQSEELMVGIGVGVLLESIRFIPLRWELVEEDFRRIWNFCTLLVLAQMVLVFTLSEEGGSNSFRTAAATVHSASAFFRWLPVTMAVMVGAQSFSQAGMVPVAAMSMLFRYRSMAGKRMINITYPYFMVCLFSAGMHYNNEPKSFFFEPHSYFWGFCALTAWAMWPLRSRRFSIVLWVVAISLAMLAGRAGAGGIGLMEQYLESYSGQWLVKMLQQKADPNKSQTMIGDIGELKLSGKIVIRVEPRNNSLPPAYLREASYWHYGSQIWSTEASTNDFQTVPASVTNENNYTLAPSTNFASTASIASYLDGWSKVLSVSEGLLPLPSGTHRLTQLPVVALAENRFGAVQADGPGMLVFDAYFGPGVTMDSATNAGDFQVPTNEVPALSKVIEEIHAEGLSDSRKLLAVQGFFGNKFTYSTWQGRDKIPRTNNETPVSRFLLYSRSGHCEYFATATVLLLRELHIPARYAVGYAVHEVRGKRYVVRERDAHAWCLVWDSSKKIWEDFDTTPGSWVATEAERASPFERLADFFSWLKYEFALFRYGQAQWRQYAMWVLVPMMLFLLYKIIFRRGRQRGKVKDGADKSSFTDWPGLDSEFYRLESRLAECGVPRRPAETLSDWLNRALADPMLADLRHYLEELLRLHYRYRFDPEGLDPLSREELRLRAIDCLEKLEPSNLEKKASPPA